MSFSHRKHIFGTKTKSCKSPKVRHQAWKEKQKVCKKVGYLCVLGPFSRGKPMPISNCIATQLLPKNIYSDCAYISWGRTASRLPVCPDIAHLLLKRMLKINPSINHSKKVLTHDQFFCTITEQFHSEMAFRGSAKSRCAQWMTSLIPSLSPVAKMHPMNDFPADMLSSQYITRYSTKWLIPMDYVIPPKKFCEWHCMKSTSTSSWK